MHFANNWLYLALIAPFLWAIVVLIDDNLLSKVYRSAGFGAMIAGLFGIFPFLYFSITNDTYSLPPKVMAASIVSGILTIIFYYFLFKALGGEEPSTAVAMLNLIPVCVAILAAVFLGERLSLRQYSGMGVIVVSSITLALLDVRRLRFSKTIVYITTGSLVMAVASILSKFAYQEASFRTVFPWVSFGFFVAGATILIFGYHSKEVNKVIKKSGGLLLVVLVITELLNFAAELTQGIAISRGPVSVIRAMEGIQPLYMLFISIALSPFVPRFFREQVDKKFPKKIMAMLLMIGGLFLIAS